MDRTKLKQIQIS